MLRAAWDLTELGWRVFPIRGGKKLPATEHGCKDATVDQEQIERWFLRTNHNLGLATGPESALWVLDVDVKTHDDGRIEDGHATLRDLEATHGQLPATVEQRTPGGGRHLFFAWPEKGDIRNSARTKLGEGLDTRGVGGYVVVAPSVRSDQGGKAYEWVRRPGETKLAPAPAWLLKLVQGERKPASPAAPPVPAPAAGAGDRLSPYARKVLDNQCDRLRQAQPGTRNSTLNEVGFILGQFVGGGAIPEALAQQHLYAAIAAWGADKDQKKTHGTLDRALAAGRAEPKSVPTPRPSGRGDGVRSVGVPMATPRPRLVAGSVDHGPPPATVDAIWSATLPCEDVHAAALLLDAVGIDAVRPPASLRACVDLAWPPGELDGAGGAGSTAALVAAMSRLGRPRAALYIVALSDRGVPAALTDPLTGEVHPPGQTVGPARGASIHLGEPQPGGELVLTLGLSTGLALRARLTAGGPAVWAVVTPRDLASIELPAALARLRLVVPPSKDPAVEEAVKAAAAAHQRPGRTITLARVTP